ncbi:DUF5320 domain-containing protein [Candidatus Pacearchaeota archaeon]|nr:DUF5320 domain-containing protein [Candidatus Pacearchaeota archaeon]
MTDIKVLKTERRQKNKMNCQGCYAGTCEVIIPRSFLTKEEKIQMLEEYKNSLEKELQGIKDRISKLNEE